MSEGPPPTPVDALPLLSASVGYGELGLGGRLGYEDGAVSVGGEAYAHALSAHPPAVLRVHLGGRFQTFRTHVALNDDAPGGAPARFSVRADGREVAAETARAGAPPALLEASVAGAQTLELRTDTDVWELCHAVWLDPAVERADDAPATGTLLDCLGRVEITLPEPPPRAERAIVTTVSPGFEWLLAGLLRTLRRYGRCDDALLVVFCVGESAEAEALAREHGAVLVPCRPHAAVNPTVKAAMYSAPLAVDAEAFVCLDADMLVLGSLRPLFDALDAAPPGGVLACRENNGLDYRSLGHALTTVYRGHRADLGRILGRAEGEAQYDLVVNDGFFAGRREALRALDATIRAMPGAVAWTDARRDVWWRNQFVFNLALARLRCGVEADPTYNVQLNTQGVQFAERDGEVRAYWNGRRVRVLHLNGLGRHHYPEWRRRLGVPASPSGADDGAAEPSRPPAVVGERAPLVSCIMPTAGRPDYVLQAVRYFERQDYPCRELVIVDDAGGAAGGRLPDDPCVRYEQVPAGWSIGRKRNRAVEVARGELVAHWDDDDWHGPGRLRAQVAPLAGGEADVTALRDAAFFDLDAWRFWSASADLHRRLFVHDVHGGTLVYRRALWGRARYPDASLAEDAAFLRAAVRRGARLRAVPAEGLYLYLRHGTNSWRLACGAAGGRGDWAEVVEPALPSADRAFYAARSAQAGGLPLVSAVMPTAGRRSLVPHAVDLFLRQTYGPRELVVVDDGPEPVDDLLPDDPRVRHLRLNGPRRIGAKRNLGAEAARGEVVAHWDDDDWYAPDRLVVQVEALRAAGTAVTGVGAPLFYAPASGRAWRYAYPPDGRPWVHGATLCYRMEAWRRQPFRDVQVGEDSLFVWAHDRAEVATVSPSVFVGMVHAGNTSPKRTAGRRWVPQDGTTVGALLGEDAAVYRRLLAAGP